MSLTHPGFPAPGWRWLKARLWDLEHAFERAKAAGRAEDDTRIRILFILALFGAGFLTLAAGAARMALFPDDGRNPGADGALGAARADLVDRNGAMLAADLLHYGLYVDPREIWDPAETRRALTAALPDLPLVRIDRALKAKRRTFLVGALTPAVRSRIHDLGLPGVTFEPEQKRIYPLGETAAHLIGFSDTGGQGLAGAERGLNDVVRRAAGQHQSVPLSIDLRVQGALDDEVTKAAKEFGVQGAVGLVTNVHTGEILAISSYPSFDPNGAKADPNALVDRAAARVYEMGSTFKTFTIAMALDSGKVGLNSTFDTSSSMMMGSRTIHDHERVNYNMTVPEIYLKSSNIGASRIAFQAGGANMTKYFDAFGLFKQAPVELTESAKPIMPRKWNDDTIASASFGHAISVSPLALAAGYGAIMNGGTYVPLTIRPMKPDARPQGRRVISEATSRAMLDLMRMNVMHGTGGKANAPGLRVGGKTGSAEKSFGKSGYVRDKLVASFASVFPADGPLEADRYFVLIMMDEPHGTKETYGFRTGGFTAAPAAGRVIDRIAPFLHVARRNDPVVVLPGKLPAADLAAVAVEEH